MAQSIRNLELGSKIKDSKGNVFDVVAHNHYTPNQTTLRLYNTSIKRRLGLPNNIFSYGTSDIAYWFNTEFSSMLEPKFVDSVLVTQLPYVDVIGQVSSVNKEFSCKYFLPSVTELGIPQPPEENHPKIHAMSYFNNDSARRIESHANYWTRSERELGYNEGGGTTYHTIESRGIISYPTSPNEYFMIVPFMNVGDMLVTDTVQNGYYTFIYNQPPVISTIPNIKGNYGFATNITYTATDSDDANLTHYISFDNGSNWQEIRPSRNNNTYTYSHVFNQLNNYNCRIRVKDSANNIVDSNMFVVSVNAVSPTISIVSVVDRVVTFKASCITSPVAKVEIFVNGTVRKTFDSGFDFNIAYEIDRSHLSIGRNAIQIKATSAEQLVGTRDLEANKTKYNLPPNGTKVIVNGIEYTITNVSENGTNQTYTLDKNLSSNVAAGDIISVLQDRVKVLCSLSNLETSKDFKEMNLVKTKKLKGNLEGYVEEKYELSGEGRYSTIKLDLERFNNDVASEIMELQQYFDYMED